MFTQSPTTTYPIEQQLETLSHLLLSQHQTLCTAESCTGGMIATFCTALAGSSQWFERGFITYSNEAKSESIGVPPELIQTHGAVSQAVAQSMAIGALQHSHAHWSIAVTGIAGPTGNTPQKPIGLVWFGFAWRTSLEIKQPQEFSDYTEKQIFPGDRNAVRLATTHHALHKISTLIQNTLS